MQDLVHGCLRLLCRLRNPKIEATYEHRIAFFFCLQQVLANSIDDTQETGTYNGRQSYICHLTYNIEAEHRPNFTRYKKKPRPCRQQLRAFIMCLCRKLMLIFMTAYNTLLLPIVKNTALVKTFFDLMIFDFCIQNITYTIFTI